MFYLLNIIKELKLEQHTLFDIRSVLLSNDYYEVRAAVDTIDLKHFKPDNDYEKIGIYIGGGDTIKADIDTINKELLLKRLLKMLEYNECPAVFEALGRTKDKRIIAALRPIASQYKGFYKEAVCAIAQLGMAGFNDIVQLYKNSPKPWTQHWTNWYEGGDKTTVHDAEGSFMRDILIKMYHSNELNVLQKKTCSEILGWNNK